MKVKVTKRQIDRASLRDEIVSLIHQRDAIAIQAQNLRNQLVDKDREIQSLKYGHQVNRERALSSWISSVADVNRALSQAIGEGVAILKNSKI